VRRDSSYPWVKVDGIGQTRGRHQIQHRLHEIAMGINEHQASAGVEVFGHETGEQRRFSRPRLPKHPQMTETVGLSNADEAEVTVMTGPAQYTKG
jgi:hypothetical protein